MFFFEGHTVGEGLPVDEDEVVLVVRVLDGAAVVLVESVVEVLGVANEDVEVLELLRRADDELEEVVEVVLDCEVVVLVDFVEVLVGWVDMLVILVELLVDLVVVTYTIIIVRDDVDPRI